MHQVIAGALSLVIPALDAATLAAAVLTAAALLFTLLLADRHSRTPVVTPLVALTLREQSARTAYVPLRDPDTAGRARPRAPGL
ncbi:hypothetical protein BWI15_21335 [Kribbella sp. ALI-6-A]|uniref:DUF6412 domain-containing protein n=1 Tax=Kribbella sp. ALI-6-A TaxID=1933817 RepID=UPI00097C30D8|nr:DUF6412 domain-containing protein [Kribbella sp. ALI-6-A]ONI69171.1 hypothetical protein BWI15_21335 [Kribbella sp. ALI-6-A]